MWTLHRILPALLFSAATLALTPACAAQVYGYRGDSAREVERHAYDNGYRSGLRAGERDARDGRVYEMERQRDWRDADGGYQRDFGDRELSHRVFRDGFRVGYSEAFNRRAVVIAPRATRRLRARIPRGVPAGIRRGLSRCPTVTQTLYVGWAVSSRDRYEGHQFHGCLRICQIAADGRSDGPSKLGPYFRIC